jgi:hypothetical protein
VSVLLRAAAMDSPVEDWRAVYWFKAAHEATVCDASEVAAAKVLDAEKQGATVRLSAGKHGAFLSEAICPQGCGADRCTEMAPLEVMRVINLGEPGAAMHGAIWAGIVGAASGGEDAERFFCGRDCKAGGGRRCSGGDEWRAWIGEGNHLCGEFGGEWCWNEPVKYGGRVEHSRCEDRECSNKECKGDGWGVKEIN